MKRLIGLCVLCFAGASFGRSTYLSITPYSDAWTSSSGYWVECSVANPQVNPQTVTITSYPFQYQSAPANGKSAQKTAKVYPSQRLTQEEAYTWTWNWTTETVATHNFPKALKVEVAEAGGFVTGACSVYWTNGSAATYTSFPMNGGKPF